MRRFQNEYFGNGQLHILNADTGALVGAFIPMNMYLDHKAAAEEVLSWKMLAQQRRERARKFAEEMERNARGLYR